MKLYAVHGVRHTLPLAGAAIFLGLHNPASAVNVDGTRVGDFYAWPMAVQTVQTNFGDNLSELNAAYVRIEDGQLYLMFTGNLENNWNRLQVFIDSVPGGMNEVYRPGSVFDRFTFDEGFEPDYLIENIAGPSQYNFAFTEFDSDITSGTDAFFDVFGGQTEGMTQTAPGATFGYSFDIAFNNSNTEGVTNGIDAADPVAARAVATGIEIGLPMEAIGNPDGTFKILALINGAGSNFLSNQFLGGLTPPQANLGSDGQGNLYQTLALVNLNDFDGEQFYHVQPTLDGDLNQDGFVGIHDLGHVLVAWNQDVPLSNPNYSDPNADGFVGIDDLNFVLGNWNAGTPPGEPDTTVSIPEPVAGTLIVITGLSCLIRRC